MGNIFVLNEGKIQHFGKNIKLQVKITNILAKQKILVGFKLCFKTYVYNQLTLLEKEIQTNEVY